MTVSIREIRRIAALARLRLEPEEAERLARDMSSILDHVAVLGRAAEPLAGVEVPGGRGESARPGGEDAREAAAAAPERETAPDPLAEPLARLAPDWREGFFVVPRLPGVAGGSGEPDGSS